VKHSRAAQGCNKKLFASGMAEEREKMKERLVPNPELARNPDVYRALAADFLWFLGRAKRSVEVKGGL
jgi:hypothetical protein